LDAILVEGYNVIIRQLDNEWLLLIALVKGFMIVLAHVLGNIPELLNMSCYHHQ